MSTSEDSTMARHRVLSLFLGLFFMEIIANIQAHRVRRLAGGISVEHKFFPYQVNIVEKSGWKPTACGGVIIDDNHIISAAHCFVDTDYEEFIKRPYVVVAGATHFKNDDRKQWVTASVKKIFIPKTFMDNLKYNVSVVPGDIAVLELETSLNISKNSHLKAISLPENEENLFADEEAEISGYGTEVYERSEKYYYPRGGVLRYSKANVLTNSECQSSWDEFTNMQEWKRRNITKKHICARVIRRSFFSEEGTCNGDSGSPLVIKRKVLIGIMNSSLNNCDESLIPGTYARVSAYKNFIEKARNGTSDSEILTTVCPIISWETFKFERVDT